MRRFLPTGIVVACVCACTAATDQYVIKLERPSKVGQVFKTEMKMTSKEMSGDHKADVVVTLSGVRKVEAVDASGDETRYSITVESCKSNGQELVAKGAVIEVDGTAGKTKRTVDGAELTAAEQVAFSDLLTTGREEGDPGLEASFGTGKKLSVGQTWALDGENASKPFKGLPFPLKVETVAGTGKLTDAKTVGGVPTVEVELSVKGDGDTATQADGSKIESPSFECRILETLPTDLAVPELKSSVVTTVSMHVTATGADGKPIDAAVKLDRDLEVTQTLVESK